MPMVFSSDSDDGKSSYQLTQGVVQLMYHMQQQAVPAPG